RGIGALGPDDESLRVWRRMALANRALGQGWPDVSAPALADRIEEWLGPEVDALAAAGRIAGRAIGPALRRLLPSPAASRFDELVPGRLRVPSSSSYRVDHPDPPSADAPALAVKLQERFGWPASPRICDGRGPVAVPLLPPAARPLAVTRAPAFCWRRRCAGVRAVRRGRYRGVPGPEDPLSAAPRRRTKPHN